MAERSGWRLNGVEPQAVILVTLLAVGIVALALLLWWLAGVLLLVFAAVLVATLLGSIARPMERWIRLPSPWSVLVACLLVAGFLGAFMALLGRQIREEIDALAIQLPDLLASLEEEFGLHDIGEVMAARLRSFVSDEGTIQNVAGFTFGTFGLLVSIVLVLVAGVYLAVRPELYRTGLLVLFPRAVRPQVDAATAHAGRALQLWLMGQLAAMAAVGVLTTAGLLAIGMPSALALGFVAAIADFVPIAGPLIAAVPAVLLAFSEGPIMVLWVIVLYVLVQQIEGYVLMPLIQRRAVDLPPVVTLFALIAGGSLFGALGIVLATPLAVVTFVMVKELYVRDTLDEPTTIPGDDTVSAEEPARRTRAGTKRASTLANPAVLD